MRSNPEEDGKSIAAEPAVASVPPTATSSLASHKPSPPPFTTRARLVCKWLQSMLFSLRVDDAPWSHPIFGYLFAILGQVIVVTSMVLLLHLYPYLHFCSSLALLVVLLIALGWGVAPSLIAMCTGAILLIFPPPLFSNVMRVEDMVGVLLYVVVGLTISLLTSQVQRERKAAQALSQHLETIIETIPDPLILYDAAGHPLRHNRSAREATWLDQQHISLDQKLSSRSMNDDRPPSFEDLPLSRSLRGEQVIGAELRYAPLGDWPERVVAISAAPLRSRSGGTIEGAVTITHDLTALRQAEREVRQRASELEAVFETLPEALYVYDQNGQVVQMNPAGAALLERAMPSSDVSRSLKGLGQSATGHEMRQSDQLPTARLLSGEVLTAANAAEVMFPSLEGETIHTSVTGAPLRDHGGQITGAVAICRDITKYRHVEEALRASEERYRTIVETAHEGIWLIDKQARTLYVNERMACLLGTSPAEMQEHTLLDFVFPEDEQEGRARIGKNLQGVAEQFEFRFRRSDGRLLETLASTSPIRDSTGTIVGALGLFTDLTARKQIEEAFEQRDTLLRLALRNSPIAVFQQDRDLRYTWMENPPSSTPEAIVGKTDADFVRPEEAAYLTKIKQHVLTTGERIREEFLTTNAQGGRWELLTLEPLRDRQGSIVGLSGTAINITERKRLEQEREELAQQAHRRASELEAIFETITDAVAVLDTEGRIVRMNQSGRQLFPRYYSPATTEGQTTGNLQWLQQRDWRGHVLPEDHWPTHQLLRGETLVGAHNQDVTVTTHEGEELLLNVASAPLYDETGKLIGAVSVTRDLTKQRRLERRTQVALEALLSMAEVMVQDQESSQGPSSAERSDLRHTAQQFATLTREVLGCERLSLYRFDADTEQLQPLAVVGLSAEQTSRWWSEQEQTIAYLATSPDSLLIERLRQHEIIIIDMTQPPWDTQPNPYGIRSMLIAPLYLKSRLIGLLELDYRGLDHVYTPDEFTLTRAVCRLLALLIEREDLLALNARLSELIERAHDAVIVCDAANRVLLWNKGAESLYGVSKQDALGKVAHTLLTTRFPVPREQIDTQLAQVGEWEGMLTQQRHEGSEVIVESRQVLLHDAVGHRAFILEINRDITEREEARASALAARETMRQMNVFVGIASHELKTPLTSIKGNVQIASRRLTNIIQQMEAKEQVGRGSLADVLLLLERAERQVNVQARLVSDLIDMSRIQTEKLELRLAKIDLVSLIQEVRENQRFLAGNHPLHVELPQEESVLVIADAVRIGQVVGNYLSNAFKYSPVDRPVEVRLTVEHRQARVEVIDQGPGLSQEQQLHIWERFYRIPSIVVQSGSSIGLGLGLHINRTLIEQHGGEVGVASTPEHGATFWFTLPLAETVARQDTPPERNETTFGASQPHLSTPLSTISQNL